MTTHRQAGSDDALASDQPRLAATRRSRVEPQGPAATAVPLSRSLALRHGSRTDQGRSAADAGRHRGEARASFKTCTSIEAKCAEMQADVAEKKQKSIEAGGLYVLGTRAAREPPHRQPAARPLWPPGRSRPLQVLPVARRRPDAHLRLRPHGRHAAEAGPAGWRGHHPSVDQQGAGEGAAEGRGAQLDSASTCSSTTT